MTGGEYKKKKRKTDVSSTIISPRKKKIGSDDIITWQWNIPGIGTAKDTQRNKKKEEGCCRWASFAASGLVHCACLALTIITFIPLLYLFLAPTVSSFSPFLFRSPSSCLPWCEHDIKKHSGTSGPLWRCDLKREEGKAQAESQCSSVVFRSYDSSNSGHVYIFILGKTLSLISFFLFFFVPACSHGFANCIIHSRTGVGTKKFFLFLFSLYCFGGFLFAVLYALLRRGG